MGRANLRQYRHKRDFSKTAEPRGGRKRIRNGGKPQWLAIRMQDGKRASTGDARSVVSGKTMRESTNAAHSSAPDNES